jgi:hypothetical protein
MQAQTFSVATQEVRKSLPSIAEAFPQVVLRAVAMLGATQEEITTMKEMIVATQEETTMEMRVRYRHLFPDRAESMVGMNFR